MTNHQYSRRRLSLLVELMMARFSMILRLCFKCMYCYYNLVFIIIELEATLEFRTILLLELEPLQLLALILQLRKISKPSRQKKASMNK